MALTKHAWKSRDNAFVLRFESVDVDGIPSTADMATVTSMLMELDGVQTTLTVDANDVDAPIDWWDAGLSAGEANFKLGGWLESASIPVGLYGVRLTLYSLNAPNGIVWTSFAQGELSLHVHDT